MNRTLRTLTCLLSSGVLLKTVTLPLPVQAQISGGVAGCPAGTRESTVNLVQNGDFAINAGTGLGNPTVPAPVPLRNQITGDLLRFTSDLPYRGDAVYPSDPPGGLSIQDERFNGGQIQGAPGNIVRGRGVTAAEAAQLGIEPVAIPTYLYSNPNLDVNGQSVTSSPPPPVIWRQTLTIAPNTVYNFKGLFFNLLLPGSGGVPPQITLQATAPNAPQDPNQSDVFIVGEGAPVPGFPDVSNTRQAWIPVQRSFRTLPGQTSIQLLIIDSAQNVFGDDFGMTAVGLRECLPNIGVAKQAGTPVANADGTFTIPYTVKVRNLAPVLDPPDPYVLNNVQLTESLSTTFANATIVSIGNLQSSTLAVNPGFNGTTDNRLLQEGVNSLAASTEGLVTFNVTIIPGSGSGGRGPYQNTVVATANTISGIRVLDRSNDGGNVDPDNDGNPNNNDNPTIVELPGTPLVGPSNFLLVKRITNVTRAGSPLPGVNFSSFVDDPASQDDNNASWTQLQSAGAPTGIISLPPTNPVQSGDEIEYTVYYLSNGSSAAIDTSICDPLPVGTSLVSNTTQVQVGNGSLESDGTAFTPLAPLPTNNSCPDQRNPTGAVIFNLGNIPNTPTNNIGFVRFRVRVN